jgi:hypothetical protein
MGAYLNNGDSELNTSDMQRTHGLADSVKAEYCTGQIPIFPTVGASIRRVKLKVSSVNCMQCMCCFMVTVSIRELSNFVVEDHIKNSSLCQHKPNPHPHCIAPG